MGGTLKIIDVYEGENLTCRARCVKQVTCEGRARGARINGKRLRLTAADAESAQEARGKVFEQTQI
jgi:hypothetical protein